MRYFNPPPATDLPAFMYKGHYGVSFYESLVEWADKEYLTAIDIAVKKDKLTQARILYNEWSGMRVLSELDHFRWLIAKIDEDTWNRMSRRTRRFIRKAYELYELLRPTRVNP